MRSQVTPAPTASPTSFDSHVESSPPRARVAPRAVSGSASVVAASQVACMTGGTSRGGRGSSAPSAPSAGRGHSLSYCEVTSTSGHGRKPMGGPVTYTRRGSVATIAMDDGKVNALSPAMLAELAAAFDQAATDNAVVVLAGRDGIFSAGFDLRVLTGGGPDAVPMLQAGFRLAERMLSFPAPVVIACTGHAIAMGVFLVLSADY